MMVVIRMVIALVLIGDYFFFAASDTSCNIQTGDRCRVGRCSVGTCRSNSGPCRCAEGFCAVGQECVHPEQCSTETPGTCHLFPCFLSRGAVDCVNGNCVCQANACSDGIKCHPLCEKATGGTCFLFPCDDSRRATCQNHACMCPPGHCAVNGVCVEGGPYNGTLHYRNSSAPALNGWIITILIAAVVLIASVSICVLKGCCGRKSSMREPFLSSSISDGEASDRCY
mmetsp:Transcript_78217/g.142276  ORF Transcript_78217/g.142276 Transcript_78217/m.142276 type:complete len:227 (+) Transcript_78217:51-731(+)